MGLIALSPYCAAAASRPRRICTALLVRSGQNACITEICYCDLAYDVLNVDIKSVLLDTTCDVMTYGKTHNATYYIAPKEDQSGRVKVYQKDKEREQVGEEKEKTLRIEISLKGRLLKHNLINSLYCKSLCYRR